MPRMPVDSSVSFAARCDWKRLMIRAVPVALPNDLAGCGNILGPVYGSTADASSRSTTSGEAAQNRVDAPRSNPKMDGPPGALAPIEQ
jgi:hypothetical protein